MKRATSSSLWLGSLLLVFATAGCFNSNGDDGDSSFVTQQQNVDKIFADSVTAFNVKVYYETGAPPYVGALLAHDTWDVTHDSYAALFQNHPARTVGEPHTLGDMTAIAPHNVMYWSYQDLIQLAYETQNGFQTGTVINIPVIFVNGYFGSSAEVLGVQITGIACAFIFKDAIKAAGGTALQQQYVEQAVVVHEVGHAVGLVHLGVTMVTQHEDGAHPGHATDSHDVMFWETDAASATLTQVADYVTGNQLNLFGTASLQDGRAYHP